MRMVSEPLKIKNETSLDTFFTKSELQNGWKLSLTKESLVTIWINDLKFKASEKRYKKLDGLNSLLIPYQNYNVCRTRVQQNVIDL